ncbi:MAG: bifunctional methylenetetrahydrofolate dehydrogenase/methenyltetrahydrofolate cyclohydrolase FolD [Desulfovibrio sp.]|jgi:methylenetetrahydrofolate dehydrogenase (NADP+)/methenyltetrahydrofolate cyclohydrolase|nr:bifunctional methylenetetrahydrofolate dehydrogenase/methenyltetrahydrofolate cyclohydrolase FolD [Desulfovibrio sp.]
MATIIDGKKTALTLREESAAEVAEGVAAGRRPPGLAVILAGEDPASQVYVRNKEKACREAGIISFVHRLPASVSQRQLLALIGECNARADVDGILLQLPLPPGLDAQACLLAIDPSKDVDGFHPENVGRLSIGLPGFLPCTPAGVMELLKRYDLSPAGKKAVVVGRSNIVGKPLGMLLSRPGPYADATVTMCHSRTRDLAADCRAADFLFLAMGKPGFVTADMVKEGAVVIDVGISRTPHGLKGDADFEGVSVKASAITPVPGGVGPMTIALLLKNTVTAWKNRILYTGGSRQAPL